MNYKLHVKYFRCNLVTELFLTITLVKSVILSDFSDAMTSGLMETETPIAITPYVISLYN